MCGRLYLRVLKAIATYTGLPWSIYMDQHGSLKRNDAHWTLEEELRGAQDPGYHHLVSFAAPAAVSLADLAAVSMAELIAVSFGELTAVL